MTEIEIRGVLDKSKAEILHAFLKENAQFEEQFKRLSVEMILDINDETRDYFHKNITFRIKKSDNKEKISLKYGDWRKDEVGEVEVQIKEGQILSAIKMFEELLFKGELVLFWESWVYEYQGYEIKLSKYKEDYYMWEIEARVDEGKVGVAKVYDLARELELEPITGEEFAKLTKWQNENLWGEYSLDKVKQILETEF